VILKLPVCWKILQFSFDIWKSTLYNEWVHHWNLFSKDECRVPSYNRLSNEVIIKIYKNTSLYIWIVTVVAIYLNRCCCCYIYELLLLLYIWIITVVVIYLNRCCCCYISELLLVFLYILIITSLDIMNESITEIFSAKTNAEYLVITDCLMKW
jgi:hypothetical protein